MRGSLSPVLASCCCREGRDDEGADLQGGPAGVRTLGKLVPAGVRLCERLRCYSDAGTVSSLVYAMFPCSEELFGVSQGEALLCHGSSMSASQGSWTCPSLFAALSCK